MAKRAPLGKREMGVKPGESAIWALIELIPFLLRDLLGVYPLTGQRIAIAKPLREIAVFAPLRAERRKVLLARFLADRTGFRGGGHGFFAISQSCFPAKAGIHYQRSASGLLLSQEITGSR